MNIKKKRRIVPSFSRYCLILLFFVQIFYLGLLINGSENFLNTSAAEDIEIDFYVVGPSELEEDKVNIREVEVLDNGTILSDENMEIAKYHIYKNEEGDEVLTGDLDWNDDEQVWEKLGIKLGGTGNGKFFVTVEFKTESMDKGISTSIKDDEKYTYQRSNILEIIIQSSIIIGIVFGIAAIVVGIYLKRQKTSVTRKTKKSEKHVKIKKIDRKKVKESKKPKTRQKKKKGKTEESEDLIFSVPKWDNEDED